MVRFGVCLFFFIWSLSSKAEGIPTFANNGDLYEACNGISVQYCRGYISGIFDLGHTVQSITKSNKMCVPPDVSIKQLVAIVTKYLKDHPETWHDAASPTVLMIIGTTFPCQTKN